MESPLKITKMYGELTNRKSKRSFETVEFAIEDYVNMKGNGDRKPTEIIELIETAYNDMGDISKVLANEWNDKRGKELIKKISDSIIPKGKEDDYSSFLMLRKCIWSMDQESNMNNMFIGYTELVCAAYEFLAGRNELMLNDVLSQCDSGIEHKDKG